MNMTHGSQRINVNQDIYIFYILVSEEKNKTLKMQGPFIHRKPDETEPDEKMRFVFKKSDFNKEKGFLSKWLRERKPNMTSLFYSIDAVDLDVASVTCKCNSVFKTKVEEKKKRYKCPSCKRTLVVLGRDATLDERRQSAMLKAHEYFEKKFENMERNYKICMRKR